MAIIDRFLQVSAAQAVTASAASTDVIDAGATKNASIGRDIGAGTPLVMEFDVLTAPTAAGAATVTFSVQDSADNSSFADVVATKAVPIAELTAGKQVFLPLPPGLRRYVRAYYTIGTGPLTAGAFNAQVVDGANFQRAYPDLL
ncbi:hypothetical protein AUR59_020115 [Stutzerimonas balearica]|jgi:hypothetical protein|uniref:Bbp16 family capsid cement protein n=1 Tax=Stutzerimonas balearica TaxID=74829 RepID=UPI00097040F6|nr:hypothetical protein [Stutzerimonas balearica]OMG61469.1 hypothetical protein AUR59_020115 [Stutzerimonas balearica]